MRRPGTTTFSKLITGSTSTNGTFVPDAGTGTYNFQTELRNTTNIETKSQFGAGLEVAVNNTGNARGALEAQTN